MWPGRGDSYEPERAILRSVADDSVAPATLSAFNSRGRYQLRAIFPRYHVKSNRVEQVMRSAEESVQSLHVRRHGSRTILIQSFLSVFELKLVHSAVDREEHHTLELF